MIAGQTTEMALFFLHPHKRGTFLKSHEFIEFCLNIYIMPYYDACYLYVMFGVYVFISYQLIFRNQLNHHSSPRRSSHAVRLSSHKPDLRLNLMVILYQQLNGSVKTFQSRAQLICRSTPLAQSQY